jgi:hypothetical protein
VRIIVVPLLVTLLAALAGAKTCASTSAKLVFQAARAPHALALDPSLADPAWKLGAIEPDGFWNVTKRLPADLKTQVYLLYDDRDLYVAFHVEQSGAPIVRTQSTNNVGFGTDDFVGVGLDTSAAGNEVYLFETTPAGVRYQQASENVRYQPKWRSTARVEGAAWNSVFIIPLDDLRLAARADQTWRFNFIRAVAAQGEHYTWAYDPLMTDGTVGQSWPAFSDSKYWPSLQLRGLHASALRKPRVELYGLASAGADRNVYVLANGTLVPQSSRPAGADFTIPITSTINAVAAVNPDFSNVEADQLTIAPQEFQRQLVEYRPFFAQGASFISPSEIGFSSPTGPNYQIFYSPNIGPFDWGAKAEGSLGLESFGLLTFRGFDASTGNTFDDTAFGYKHALPDNTFAYWVDGVSAHHSIAGDDTTIDAGVTGHDAKTGFEWGTDQTLEEGSWVPYTRIAHSSLQFVAMNKSNYQAAFAYNDISPNYNPIDGLTFNSDLRGFQGFVGASGSAPWAKNYSIALYGDRWLDKSGGVHEADTLATLTAVFKDGLSIDNLGPSVGILRTYDIPAEVSTCSGRTVSTSSFTGYPCYRNGQDQPFNLFTTAVGYKDGTPTPIDVSYAFGPFGDNYTQLFTIATSRPLGRFTIGLDYDGTYERAFDTGELDSQFLRRISLGRSIGAESNVSLSIVSINGLGGFATQTGTNVAFGYHQRFSTGNELFVSYGTPATYTTLDRFIAKYVLHLGGDAGT